MDRFKAVLNLVGGELSESAEGVFTYHDGQTPPSESEIVSELKKLTDAYDAQAYARNRAAEYPIRGDQFDMIYKDMLNSTTTHKDTVEAVKTKWPKDNSGPVE